MAAAEGRRWRGGPTDERGCVVNVSDRPSLCMSVMGCEAAVGSSDHAVYIIHIPSATFRKALYGSNAGHSEWVTAVAHLPDGRLLSGGMDSKLLVWDTPGGGGGRRPSCREPRGGRHSASISAIAALPMSRPAAVSASYDRTLAVWDLSSSVAAKRTAELRGHSSAVMAVVASPTTTCHVASGCRGGGVIFWDAAAGKLVASKQGAHAGHVTAMETVIMPAADASPLFLSGGQDGVLRAWDLRSQTAVHSATLHSSTKGQGALSCISVSQNAQGFPLIVTAGADKTMKVLDPRASFKVVHTLNGHRDFIYCLMTSDSLAWSGSGDGSILVHDLLSGKCLYGLGASSKESAIRCISLATALGKEYIVCTGDDGNVMIYRSP